MAATQFVFGTLGAGGGIIPAMLGTSVTSETISTSGSNQSTTAVALARHNVVRVTTDTACYVAFGTAPDATTAGARIYLAAGVTEYFGIVAGQKGACVTA